MKLHLHIAGLGVFFFLVAGQTVRGQGIFYSKKATISFFSKASIENIEADNKNVVFIADLPKGRVQAEVLMNAFEFDKKLMQEHFNENYVESGKYPKAIFKGQFISPVSLDPSKEGEYTVKIRGDLTMHGVTKPVEAEGTLKVAGGRVMAGSTFFILLSDFDIKIPHIVADNISNKIQVRIDATLEPFK